MNNMGNFDLVEAIKNPDAIIQRYKSEAMKGGLILIGAFIFVNWLMVNQAVKKHVRKRI